MFSVFFAKAVNFLLPKHASRSFLNEFLQYYWQEPFDGDSFGSQSRFEAYAVPMCFLQCYLALLRKFQLRQRDAVAVLGGATGWLNGCE